MITLLDLQIACDNEDLPTKEHIQSCLDTVLEHQDLSDQEMTVRIVSSKESQQLNSDYRGKNTPTNVLSFPFEAPPGTEMNLLGDLVICADIVEHEASAQNKPTVNHWSHMLVHGALHLLGYDHVNDQDAEQMEALEIAILAKLSIDDPYQDH